MFFKIVITVFQKAYKNIIRFHYLLVLVIAKIITIFEN